MCEGVFVWGGDSVCVCVCVCVGDIIIRNNLGNSTHNIPNRKYLCVCVYRVQSSRYSTSYFLLRIKMIACNYID